MADFDWQLGAVGSIIVLSIAYLGIVLHGYRSDIYEFNEATIYATIGGALATIVLASIIYYQNYQNNQLIRQNNEQSLILQESEWMPTGVFRPDELRFAFRRNRPYNPKTILEIGESDTGWIELEVSDRDRTTDEWFVGIGGEIYEENLGVEKSSFDGILRLRFKSTTGCLYEYQYDVEIDTEVDNSERIKVNSEKRKLPWRDDIE